MAGKVLSMDKHVFNPPVWKFKKGKCFAVKRGSSSYQAYGFATEAACIAKCGEKTQASNKDTQDQAGNKETEGSFPGAKETEGSFPGGKA
mmetsp:Transcript_22052/g.42079  ORF Transcript_22052/g.42079 Transcript_22052/m.42079 type:complete len:90 (-) Transcript_22052:289-558(-)